MLKELKTLFAQQAEQELLQTTRDFHSCRQEERQSLSSYVLKMNGYIDNLERLGHPVTLGLGTVNELHAMLKLYEQTLPKSNAHDLHAIRAGKVQKGNKHKKSQSQTTAKGQNHGKGKNKQAYAPKHKIPPPPKRENPAKDSICHEYGKIGHWKRNCPQYLADLMKKKKNTTFGAGGPGIFVIELNIILNRSWIYETCCGTHIYHTTQGLRDSRKVKPGLLAYTWAMVNDGIFEIDLYNSLTNESSVYAVSNKRAKQDLDSALLWHYRLRHISKKCIEKSQHDGLLDSFDLTVFEKCISCMSEKMARKPYTHQVERAKDLLGLIHTDVCGPFKIMSRQGASYFVAFTNDFSSYGYVYLLKHKHEVFETFKVFQKEVENQLGSWDFRPSYSSLHSKTQRSRCKGSLEDLEIIQEEDTHPSLDTSLNHEEDDLEIYELQSDIVPIRRSIRTRHTLDRMCLYIDAEEHELGDLEEPTNYKAALLDLESKKWLNAMNVEMQSMKENEVWVLVELPPNGKTVGSYTQTLGIDYEETFSPVADVRAIRILIAIATYYDYEIWKMDVKTAFLNRYLNEEVYMEQPEGFVNPIYPNRVCKLKRSIYGLKQTLRQWNKRFNDKIKKFVFTQNRDEPCVYIKASGSNITFLILYVDDILIMGNSIPMLQSVKTYLGKCCAMKDLGEAAYILGIKIYRDRSKRLISLCQSVYIKKILKRYCMKNSKCESIPMQEKLELSKSQGASTPAEIKRMKNVPYASAVGSIMYDVRCTCPDVAFAQNVTS
nr:retrotransposon protein, putative, Ty1-copia subclass [Tanacetum cinerariifolium]